MTTDPAPIDWSNFTIQSDQKIEIRQPITPSNFVFHSGGANTEVGRFEVIDGQMRFTGNVDETGKVMIEWFLKAFNDRIEADKKALRDQSAALLEALKDLQSQYKERPSVYWDWSKARAAIAQAEGRTA
jgi:5-methylthioribose kinase